MEPFRAPRPACARCGAPDPDHLSPTGDTVCRACAVLPGLDVQLAKGRREGVVGSIVALVLGITLLAGTLALGVPSLVSSRYGGPTVARLVGLGVGLGIVLVVASVRSLRIYLAKDR